MGLRVFLSYTLSHHHLAVRGAGQREGHPKVGVRIQLALLGGQLGGELCTETNGMWKTNARVKNQGA